PSATARPPADALRGSARRFETTTSRLIAFVPPSDHGVPGRRQPDRPVDDADHRIGLREIAPHLARHRMSVLRKQAEVVAIREHRLEYLPGLGAAPDAGERVDPPEGADVEGGLGLAEVVG